MKDKIINIIRFYMGSDELANLKADEILELFAFSDEKIGELVNKIAYTQTAEDQADDFLNKVWMVKEFLNSEYPALCGQGG